MIAVYQKIKTIREDKRIKQSEMAGKLKIAQNNYGKLERGEIQLSVDRLFEIGKIFKMSVAEIINYGEDYLLENEKIDILKEELRKARQMCDLLIDSSIPLKVFDNYVKEMEEKALKGEGVIFADYDSDGKKIVPYFAKLSKPVTEEDYQRIYAKIRYKLKVDIDIMKAKHKSTDSKRKK